MKLCFKCGVDKPLTDYYKHKQMGDGHLNKCKTCTKKDTKKRTDILTSTPEGLEKERARHRDKYFRLGYKEKHKPTTEKKLESMRRNRDKYPEKYKARCRTSGLKAKVKGNHLHHWSYNEAHYKDIIELSVLEHNKLHRFIKYDQETFMYKTLNGLLLDTKEKHLKYFDSIKQLE